MQGEQSEKDQNHLPETLLYTTKLSRYVHDLLVEKREDKKLQQDLLDLSSRIFKTSDKEETTETKTASNVTEIMLCSLLYNNLRTAQDEFLKKLLVNRFQTLHPKMINGIIKEVREKGTSRTK